MEIRDLSICFTTPKLQECREFYTKYFDVDIAYDHSWYLTFRFKWKRKIYLSFMNPQNNEPIYNNGGVTINLWVKDVDAEYQRLKDMGLEITRQIQDNPWGDRSFEVNDPLGNILYIYKFIKLTKEYIDSNKELTK